jgi:hypothetical protein
LYFRRFDSLEKVMDDKMKMLFDVANTIALTNARRQSNISNQLNEVMDSKTCFVIDKLVFPKDK